jgi:hypothetical protein
MTVERTLRLIAGGMVLLSAGLAAFVSPWWLLLTAFVGLNLLQSGLTNWCPMMSILRAAGMRECGERQATPGEVAAGTAQG